MLVYLQRSKRVQGKGVEVFMPFELPNIMRITKVLESAGFDVENEEVHLCSDGIHWLVDHGSAIQDSVLVVITPKTMHISACLESLDDQGLIDAFKEEFSLIQLSEKPIPMDEIVQSLPDILRE